MTVFFHEMRRSKLSLIIWSAAISFMLGISILIFPEMSGQMDQMSEMFANMGSFSDAFGMDQLNFGEFMGYFGIECGNVLGIGGALFAAITGISALSKEENQRTAEFLLTHPISRVKIVIQKLLSVIAQIVLLELAVAAVAGVAIFAIGESVEVGKLVLIFVAYLVMQLEIGAITFGISAFMRRGGVGIGLGLALMFYFVNIISNLTDGLEVLKFITPFGYTDSSYIISNGGIALKYLVVGVLTGVAVAAAGAFKYNKKDIS